MSRRGRSFACIRTQGGLLPQDQLERIAALDKGVVGLKPEAYRLDSGRPIIEAVSEAWSRLQARWRSLKEAVETLEPTDGAVRVTRDRFLLPLFRELEYGPLPTARLQDDEGRSFPISHAWEGRVPVHLMGWNVSLDERRRGTAGAASSSPHGLLQDFLNRSDKHLWGFVTNGRQLRILRDHQSLARLAFVEFDLEAIFEDEQFSEFVILWLVCHQSRVHFEDSARDCLLEKWHEQARNEGVRALDKLRGGVEKAIQRLGQGFLRHPGNTELHEQLRTDGLKPQQYYRELLRIAYRLIFLFVAEDRGLLLLPDGESTPGARELYDRWYSTRRLRELSLSRRGGPHPDLWRSLRLVMAHLDEGREELALPALGSFLWREGAVPWAPTAEISNEDLLSAIRALCEVDEGGDRRVVSWQNVGAEELGSVYESLLELRPRLDRQTASFEFVTAAGHERKTTGSYYTPTSLVECLLDTALDPVVEDRLKGKTTAEEKARAILDIKVCDPACGSGHFLVAAARRLARRLAQVRSGDDEPSPAQHLTAMREVVSHCLFGADLNEMAIELAKVSLWMEAIEPGKPLSFLDAHFAHGNSLLGATPALMEKGIPDDAFKPIEGDDKNIARELKAANKKERTGQQSLMGMMAVEAPAHWDPLEGGLRGLETAPEDTAGAVREKERAYRRLRESDDWRRQELLADAWCAAFAWPKQTKEDARFAITESAWQDLVAGKPMAAAQRARVEDLKRQHRYLHWQVEFPQVFRARAAGEAVNPEAGWDGGFDVVLGNPPWERIKLQEKEWFAERVPEVAGASTAAVRGRLIKQLEERQPETWASWREAKRASAAESHLVRSSGTYPLCGRGDINTYSVFAELGARLPAGRGRCGLVLPTGIATDDTTKAYFSHLVASRRLHSVHGFENEERLFPGVHHAFRFCLLSIAGRHAPVDVADLLFLARNMAHRRDPERHFTLTADEFERINPNTLTCPTFRWRRDAQITKAIYHRVPVLWREGDGDEERNPWGLRFMAMLHMANDSGAFRSRGDLEASDWRAHGNRYERPESDATLLALPLYEAKMIHHFDHRFGTYEGQTEAQGNQGKLPEATEEQHADPSFAVLPRYWVDGEAVAERLEGRWDRGWLLGWRDITGNEKRRTVIASVLPRVAVGHKLPLAFPSVTPHACAALLAVLSSFVLDYVARQKVGGTSLTYFVVKQFAVPTPQMIAARPAWSDLPLEDWLLPRVLELTYTAWDLEPWARDLGWNGPPFRWDPSRRFLLRCELDAAFFHLYGLERDDVDYIMETFPIVKKKDLKAHGAYRTKDTILSIHDAMSEAARTATPYQTLLDPPPADPSLCHPPREERATHP